MTARTPDATEALLFWRQFRALRLSSLRMTALCALPLWIHAYLARLPGLAVWLAVLGVTGCAALTVIYGASERKWRLRSRDAPAAAAVLDLRGPAFDQLRSGLLSLAALLLVCPWLEGLGWTLPARLHATAGALAAVVGGPALALELWDLVRAVGAAQRG